MDNIQKIQNDQYNFPYHHIARIGNGKFSQVRELRFGYEYIAYLTEILKIIKNYKVENLLDIGCGDGKFLFEANKIFNSEKLEGVDYSKKAISFARAFSPEIKFHIGDIKEENILNKKGVMNKIIKTILSNRIFILNQYKTQNLIYRFYCKYLLHAKETNCQRLMVICKAK